MNAITNFINDESGITAIEYALMAAALGAIITVAFTGLGDGIKSKINEIIDSLGGTKV
ncbi:Flp family type IVb pilin [Duganella sp. BuS-21]|uniref:Flp family type IVb pilin n=1 Tax=Duganella sp. BuS-21 TaxID=2943848 RepID=UPI0035A582FF